MVEATIGREDALAVWDGLCVAAQYEPGSTRCPWVRETDWARFRLAMLSFALVHGDPDSVDSVIDGDPNFDLDWCAACFGAEGCISCTEEPRPHHGCLGWLCTCPCGGAEV